MAAFWGGCRGAPTNVRGHMGIIGKLGHSSLHWGPPQADPNILAIPAPGPRTTFDFLGWRKGRGGTELR
eukprot:11766235-Alexandrium_andersonii.AAC.1